MNSVTLIGRLTRDPEVRHTNEGMAIARFSIAIDRPKKKDGTHETDFPNIICFGYTAENVEKYIGKGRLVGIVGRIQTGSYTNRNGDKVYTTEVAASNVEFLDRGEKQTQQGFGQGFNQQGFGQQGFGQTGEQRFAQPAQQGFGQTAFGNANPQQAVPVNGFGATAPNQNQQTGQTVQPAQQPVQQQMFGTAQPAQQGFGTQPAAQNQQAQPGLDQNMQTDYQQALNGQPEQPNNDPMGWEEIESDIPF